MYIPNILKNFPKFFLLVTHLLSKSPYVCFGVAWSIHESIGSYAQGLWLSGTVDLVIYSCSVSAAVCLCSGPCVALWINPGSGSLAWLVRVVEQYVVGDWLGLLSGWGITVVYCSICSQP